MDVNKLPGKRNSPLSLEELSGRYRLILDTYEELDVPVLPVEPLENGFVEGPASVLYRVRPGLGVDTSRIKDKAEALKLALELDADQNIRFEIDRGYVTIVVPKVEQDRYFISAQELWAKWNFSGDTLSVPLGLDNLGNVVSIDFSSPSSTHLLIAGTMGLFQQRYVKSHRKGLMV